NVICHHGQHGGKKISPKVFVMQRGKSDRLGVSRRGGVARDQCRIQTFYYSSPTVTNPIPRRKLTDSQLKLGISHPEQSEGSFPSKARDLFSEPWGDAPSITECHAE